MVEEFRGWPMQVSRNHRNGDIYDGRAQPPRQIGEGDTKMKRNQVVMVTGASAGLGRAIAHGFAKQGARIGLIARNREALEACREEVEEMGGEGLVLPLDVSDAPSIEHAANRLEEAFGPIDVWVNNAMASVFSPVKKMTAEEYKRVTEVSYLGYVYGTQAALRRMLPRDRGTIIQVGSALAVRSIPLQSAYCAAKHAIIGFTDSLTVRTLPRQEQCSADGGADAGDEYRSVYLGQEPATGQAAARAADFSTGGRRESGGACCQCRSAASRVLGGFAYGGSHRGADVCSWLA